MNKILAWVIFILVLVGVAWFSVKTFNTKQVEFSEIKEIDSKEVIVSETKEKELPEYSKISIESSQWKWGEYTFTLPGGWGARSYDSGSVSALAVGQDLTFFEEPFGASIIIYKTGKCDYDVEPGKPPAYCMTREDFMKAGGIRHNSEIQKEKILSQKSFIFLNRKAIKQTTELDGKFFEKYYIIGMDFITFIIPLDIKDTEKIREILNSLNLIPTSEDLFKAQNTP